MEVRVFNEMQEQDIRGFIDERDEKIGKKIRDAEVKKIPYMLIVGEKEAADGAVSVRQHGEGDIGSMEKGEFIRFFQDKVAELIQ